MGAGSRLVYASYAMAIGTLSAPVITEKIFKGNPKPTIFIGCGIAGLLVLTIRTLQPDNTALLIAVPCAILFFSSFVNPTLYGYIAKHYPSSISGRIGGLVMGLTIFGATVGLGVSSTLLHKTGFYWASMNVLAGVTMLGAIAVLALRLPKGFNVAEQEGR
jgi:MFS family permease